MAVTVYRSTDYGAPSLYGAVGYLIPLLEACLVNGYGTLSVTSLTHSGGTVTATTASAHGLTSYGRQTISGANETGYNGTFAITVTGSTTFTYSTTGVTVDTATGTVTTKTPGSGWTKPYAGTNLGAFRQGGGNQHYLRVDDTATSASRVVAYEAMTAISAGTGPFPTSAQFSGGLYMQRSSTTDGTNPREWILIADDKTFYLWVGWNSTYPYNDSPILGFGHFVSRKNGDAFNTFLLANTGTSATYFRFSYLATTIPVAANTGMYLARSYSQIGSAVEANRISDSSKANSATNMGVNGLVYPHQPDQSLLVAPVWVVEVAMTTSNNSIRGVMPGVWNPLHNRPLAHGDTFSGSGDLAGKRFLAINCQASAQVMFEISDTWGI